MLCKKCVLPENKPDIELNSDGICNICVDFQKRDVNKRSNVLLESEMIKILNRYKGKNKSKYDCLVMCSGGKDSTASLYYMKRRYKMSPLAFTFDHGFEEQLAIDNIRNAVEILNIDWVYYKADSIKDIFVKMIKERTVAPICHICAIWYLGLTYDTATRYNIPLVVAGWTKGQSLEGTESGIEYKSMSEATSNFIVDYLHKDKKYKDFPRSIKEAVKMGQRKFKIQIISPHWFLQYQPDEIREILQNELKWKSLKLSYPQDSTNCLMNFVGAYLSLKNFGYTHYHIETSKLIRLGELSREEALKNLEFNFDTNFLNSILEKIGCKLEE
jgi:tRNA(Ile)-lysidine synthase TilS/MesJ